MEVNTDTPTPPPTTPQVTVPPSLPTATLLSSGALLCSYNQCFCTGVDVLARWHVAMSGDSLGCHRRMYRVESKDAAEA